MKQPKWPTLGWLKYELLIYLAAGTVVGTLVGSAAWSVLQ